MIRITQEEFCSLLRGVKMQTKYNREKHNHLIAYTGLSDVQPYSTDFIINPVIDFLRAATIKTDPMCLISFFIYDLDFGQRYRHGIVTDEGNNIDISTPEKLYQALLYAEQKKDHMVNKFSGLQELQPCEI